MVASNSLHRQLTNQKSPDASQSCFSKLNRSCQNHLVNQSTKNANLPPVKQWSILHGRVITSPLTLVLTFWVTHVKVPKSTLDTYIPVETPPPFHSILVTRRQNFSVLACDFLSFLETVLLGFIANFCHRLETKNNTLPRSTNVTWYPKEQP